MSTPQKHKVVAVPTLDGQVKIVPSYWTKGESGPVVREPQHQKGTLGPCVIWSIAELWGSLKNEELNEQLAFTPLYVLVDGVERKVTKLTHTFETAGPSRDDGLPTNLKFVLEV
jgi:hypothetical protein